jgi:hypothetical protein
MDTKMHLAEATTIPSELTGLSDLLRLALTALERRTAK